MNWTDPLEQLTVEDLVRSGACREGVMEWYNRLGKNCTAMPTSKALRHASTDASEYIRKAARLSGFSGYGDGCGYGYGYGYGCGDGYGYGDDDGYGYGYGCGYGYGYGCGDGYGCGYGYGYGCGDGYGDDDGYGYGYGYGEQ